MQALWVTKAKIVIYQNSYCARSKMQEYVFIRYFLIYFHINTPKRLRRAVLYSISLYLDYSKSLPR